MQRIIITFILICSCCHLSATRNEKKADWRNRNAFKSLPRRNALISIFNGGGSYFSILRKFWFCHATLIV